MVDENYLCSNSTEANRVTPDQIGTHWAHLHEQSMQLNTLWHNLTQSKLIPMSASTRVFKGSNLLFQQLVPVGLCVDETGTLN